MAAPIPFLGAHFHRKPSNVSPKSLITASYDKKKKTCFWSVHKGL